MAKRKHVVRYCEICGKEFKVRSEICQQKTCSAACNKERLKRYNTQYVAEKRRRTILSPQAIEKRNRDTNIRNGKRAWKTRLKQAEIILELANYQEGRELIAYFIDREITARNLRNAETTPQEELDAQKMFEDLIARNKI